MWDMIPFGVADHTDAARAFEGAAPTLANYRCSSCEVLEFNAASAAQSTEAASAWDGASAILTALPNPSAGSVTISASTVADGPVSLEVYDVLGRRIHSYSAEASSGSFRYTWDGRAGDGHLLSGGTYFVVLRTEGAVRALPITFAR